MVILSTILLVGSNSSMGSTCAEERMNARLMASRIAHEWPLRDPKDSCSHYLQKLINNIARGSREASQVSWHSRVVRDYAPNAYSIGAGYIFVTEGAIRLCRTESELAGILAHEMGHELAGHFCPEPSRGWGGLFNPFGFGREAPPRRRSEIGSLTQEFDPEKEREADHVAVTLLNAAGFDTQAMLDVARRMTGSASRAREPERLDALKHLLSGSPPKNIPDSIEFFEIQKSLANEHRIYRAE
jgi:predicted Zn-dependent protease